MSGMITYEEDYERPYQFHCTAAVIPYRRDRDNYLVARSPTDERNLEADSLQELFEMMARYKVSGMRPPDRDGERSDVEFGTIYQSIAYLEPNDRDLENTEAWQAHLVKVEAKRIAEAEAEADRAAKWEAAKEKQERELLATLLAKHGPQ